MSITVDIRGLGALAQDFATLKRGAQRRVLRQATMAGARVGRDAIRDAAPVDEGITRKNVVAASAKQNEPGQHTAGVRVRGERRDDGSSPAYTWRFSELGTSKEPARPWIRPTWDSNEEEIAEAVRNRLGSAIDEALGRR
ncbi:HK97 gp10 family phage protein [Luteimonas sp BLCC-B24]|uniref:HK97-gp10 family putative phage morphogenesis protein n=1 Tax=Luteimonas sp. BLCC-B24 TaxID=3025317 RepID=UPI00234C4A85|nr:HK97-gp10 family putative phage morphogenesis protein [Luteimonas sp. BLCC-B24]MDC7805529.1 HK97 gp10 family phage protein [Luteimonas sp. BLCC-B24]